MKYEYFPGWKAEHLGGRHAEERVVWRDHGGHHVRGQLVADTQGGCHRGGADHLGPDLHRHLLRSAAQGHGSRGCHRGDHGERWRELRLHCQHLRGLQDGGHHPHHHPDAVVHPLNGGVQRAHGDSLLLPVRGQGKAALGGGRGMCRGHSEYCGLEEHLPRQAHSGLHYAVLRCLTAPG